ncbi:MAG TPA: enoyl-CoA hydratase/isomerase family protein [Acidimicrobiales bacterium]|nr:enoyl-CoA hydratase/isomerase family protein [Acidimicrobiales bacterium]
MTEDRPTSAADDVSVETDGAVAVLTLRRPPHNLLTEPALRRLADAVHDLSPEVRAAVVCSEGRSFCAGADFKASDAPDPTAEGSDFSTNTGAFYRQAVRIFSSPVPLVAAVQGAAIGAGFGLALACDIRVVGERGWFQANFVRLGIHPGFALSVTLPRFVGPGRASELFLTGRRIDAEEALRIGLAEKMVPSGSERDMAVVLANEIAGGAPLAVASTRATLRAGLAVAAEAAMAHELAEQTRLAGTADAVEGVAAMLAGRPPRFSGA